MDSLAQLIHKPKVIIPLTAVLALAIGAIFYGSIGRAPSIQSPIGDYSHNARTPSSYAVNLSFLKTGRVAKVAVQVGDQVREGEVLSTLDAADTLGALNQAHGALELAKAQYASLNVQYANAQKQQDVLVNNAYRVLLSSGLAAVANNKASYSLGAADQSQTPQVSGTYTCDATGTYEIDPYPSGTLSGYSFDVRGLEKGGGIVANFTPQPIGSCGLFILFPVGYASAPNIQWLIEVPNTRADSYAANKNAYDLALATRDQVLKQLEANLGAGSSVGANIAQAAIDAAEGTYEVALANYTAMTIVAPAAGTVTFVDDHLKTGESAIANKTVITIVR